MQKVSEKLTSIISTNPPNKLVKLNIMLRHGLSEAEFGSVISDLAKLSKNVTLVKILPRSDLIFLDGPLNVVPHIANHPDIEWIDQDATASMEELADG